jgi:hypothetical protein
MIKVYKTYSSTVVLYGCEIPLRLTGALSTIAFGEGLNNSGVNALFLLCG